MSAGVAEIRRILVAHGALQVPVDGLGDASDLYQVGLTSHASVNVMLALEDAFGVEFPDSMLKKNTFQSISAMREALESIGATVEPA